MSAQNPPAATIQANLTAPETLTLPRWYDLHVHLRQGPAMKDYIAAHKAMGCAGLLAMPNTRPPVGKVFESDSLPYWSIEAYRAMIRAEEDRAQGDGGSAAQAAPFEDVIVPLYLTRDTTPSMIARGAESGLLRAAKYYPPHGTTNADHGFALNELMKSGVIDALSDNNIVLCLHGEEHGLSGDAYFGKDGNAEDYFYRERLPRLRDEFPELKIVCEHITTETAVNFVREAGDKTGATITPQHLLYTMGDLVQGFKYHLYCLPLVKFAQDRAALCEAVNDPANRRFFAGTDSAPHTTKCTPCGCAAGCFTGGIAPQLYIEAFDFNKGQYNFKRFLCENGPDFYGLPAPTGSFTLRKRATRISPLQTEEGEVLPLSFGLGAEQIAWELSVDE